MPVGDADIVIYGSNVMADDDTTLQIGGAKNTAIEMVFINISPAGTVEMLSSGADTRTLTIHYLDAAGIKGSEVQTLNGTTPVAFSATMASILKAVLSASHGSNTVTLRKSSAGATLKVFQPAVTQIRRPFYDALANTSGGATKTYFEKVFVQNNNATLALTLATIAEQADPNSVIDFALETSLNGTTDNGAGNNRQVAPSGFTFDSTTKAVANSQNLTAGSAQGVWMRLTLAAGITPADTSWTLRLAGVSA